MLMLNVNGLSTRVQELENRLDRLARNVGIVKSALSFTLDGIRSALYKAEYTEMRSKQLEVAKVEGKTLKAVFESDEPKSPPGERESLENFARRLFGPGSDGNSGTTIKPPRRMDDSQQGSPNRGKPRVRYPVSPTTTWGGKPGESLPDAPQRGAISGSPVRTHQQEEALARRARQRQHAQPSPQSTPAGIRRLVVPLNDLV